MAASSMAAPRLEPATDADIPAIVALMNRAYRDTSEASWTTEADYISGARTNETMLRDDIAGDPDATMLVWRRPAGGPLLGCVWLQPEKEGVWYLGSLSVDPGEQNRGLGRSLLAAAEAWAQEHGARRIKMTVINVRDALLAWYARRGYAPTGETEPFPYGDERFGIPRRDDLHFVVLQKPL